MIKQWEEKGRKWEEGWKEESDRWREGDVYTQRHSKIRERFSLAQKVGMSRGWRKIASDQREKLKLRVQVGSHAVWWHQESLLNSARSRRRLTQWQQPQTQGKPGGLQILCELPLPLPPQRAAEQQRRKASRQQRIPSKPDLINQLK